MRAMMSKRSYSANESTMRRSSWPAGSSPPSPAAETTVAPSRFGQPLDHRRLHRVASQPVAVRATSSTPALLVRRAATAR